MQELSLAAARRIVVNSHLTPAGIAFRNVKAVVEHLGYLQIDTISVVERAHHHVLWTRLPKYRNKLLEKAEEQDRSIFEYWAHAAAYLPINDYRFSLIKKNALQNGEKYWFKGKDKKLRKRIMEQVKSDGAIMSKDLEDTRKQKSDAPWAWKPAKVALWQLFMEGHLMVTKRVGFQKVYDLPERVLPANVNQSLPTHQEYIRFLIKRTLKAQGLAKPTEISYLLKGIGKEVEKELDLLLEEQLVEQVKISKRGLYYTLPDRIDELGRKRKRRVKILSPFDNLVIQRKRLAEIFGLQYIMECYLPEAKRKFGYFGMPLLWGNDVVGQIDLKADRKRRQMIVRNLQLINTKKQQESMSAAFVEELYNLAAFAGCTGVAIESDIRKRHTSVVLDYLETEIQHSR